MARVVAEESDGASVDLPQDIESEDDNARPETLAANPTSCNLVPRPMQSLFSAVPGRPQHIAEFYSPPRVLPIAGQVWGLTGDLSLDLATGWDFCCSYAQELSLHLLVSWCVAVLLLSPPCTAFSPLQELWQG